jgi:hypothetical protein
LKHKVGFRFIPLPQEIVDERIDLTLNEFRLLTYITRHQFRLRQAALFLCHDDLLNGRRLPDGTSIDKGCGITNPRGIREARESLKARGFIDFDTSCPSGEVKYWVTFIDFDDIEEGVQKGQGGVQKGQDPCPKRTGKHGRKGHLKS